MRGLLSLLISLLYVPKCVGCGTRLAQEGEVLCPLCLTEYENEKGAGCPVCGTRMGDCFCLPPAMQRRGVRRMHKLFLYRPKERSVPARMLYTLKHKPHRPLQDFFAAELAPALTPLVSEGEWVLTHAPRSKRALQRDGFDHAAALAQALAARLSVPHAPLLRRTGHGEEQKRLSREARYRAAIGNYEVRQGVSLVGKRVLLCDDICTTGATLLSCARLLRRAGAREVVCVTLALTPQRNSR